MTTDPPLPPSLPPSLSGKATNVMTHGKLKALKEKLQQEDLLPKECGEVEW